MIRTVAHSVFVPSTRLLRSHSHPDEGRWCHLTRCGCRTEEARQSNTRQAQTLLPSLARIRSSTFGTCVSVCLFQVVHGTANKDVIEEKLAKWSAAAGKEVRFVKEL
jgi:hypothetical protein